MSRKNKQVPLLLQLGKSRPVTGVSLYFSSLVHFSLLYSSVVYSNFVLVLSNLRAEQSYDIPVEELRIKSCVFPQWLLEGFP